MYIPKLLENTRKTNPQNTKKTPKSIPNLEDFDPKSGGFRSQKLPRGGLWKGTCF
jgi:hypothetical protein